MRVVVLLLVIWCELGTGTIHPNGSAITCVADSIGDPEPPAPIEVGDTLLTDGQSVEVCADYRMVQPSRMGDDGFYSYTGEAVVMCDYEHEVYLPIVTTPN